MSRQCLRLSSSSASCLLSSFLLPPPPPLYWQRWQPPPLLLQLPLLPQPPLLLVAIAVITATLLSLLPPPLLPHQLSSLPPPPLPLLPRHHPPNLLSTPLLCHPLHAHVVDPHCCRVVLNNLLPATARLCRSRHQLVVVYLFLPRMRGPGPSSAPSIQWTCPLPLVVTQKMHCRGCGVVTAAEAIPALARCQFRPSPLPDA